MMRSFFFSLLLTFPMLCQAQDSAYVRRMIDSLCAPRYHGRGYVLNGDVKAADFLVRQCKSIGLAPLKGSFTQAFELGVNTFPGAMDLSINGKLLETGEDYIPNPNSYALHGDFKAFSLKPKWTDKREKLFKLSLQEKVKKSMVVLDATDDSPANQAYIVRLGENPINAKGYVVLTDKKLTWSVGRRMYNIPILEVTKASVGKKIRSISLDMDQAWVSNYQAKNVTAYIPGMKDSMVVFTAHYDHLGRMGADTYIAGASDNASGTAMLLDLARHYKMHPPEYTTVFIWFAGEEAGLVGSTFFVDHSPIELNKIKFLLNLDLMADAKTGITAVNGKIFSDQFDNLVRVNNEVSKLSSIKARGSAANSDHYPFFQKDVPCFFIYTMGDYKHYHDIHDVPENIPLTNYKKVFDLMTGFVARGLDY